MDYKNYIRIHNNQLRKGYFINFKSHLSNEDVIAVKITKDKIIISRVDIDRKGETHKLSRKNSGWSIFNTRGGELEVGSYYIDNEESDEDNMVIYLEDIKEI